ncbi:hypothetical protein ACH3VS_04085 [Streptomyces sp. WSLK1-3]|uniref:hypothetical protein n=1 Tax=Streptomyces sp. WSLK1-3 TaxID=3375475 RepID=UPI0037B473CF
MTVLLVRGGSCLSIVMVRRGGPPAAGADRPSHRADRVFRAPEAERGPDIVRPGTACRHGSGSPGRPSSAAALAFGTTSTGAIAKPARTTTYDPASASGMRLRTSSRRIRSRSTVAAVAACP